MPRKTSPKRRVRKTSPKRRVRKTSPKRRIRKTSPKRRMNPGSEPQWDEYHHHQGHGPSSLTHPHGRLFDDDKKITVRFHNQLPDVPYLHNAFDDFSEVLKQQRTVDRNISFRDHQRTLKTRHTIRGMPTEDDQEVFIRSVRKRIPVYGREGTHLLAEALTDSDGHEWGAKIYSTRAKETSNPVLEYVAGGSTLRRVIE